MNKRIEEILNKYTVYYYTTTILTNIFINLCMSTLHLKVKKLNKNAVTPKFAKPGDAGMDLTAISKEADTNNNIVYGIGIALEIPEGYVGLIFPRSSNSKQDLLLSNSVGVIDSGYRGEIIVKFKKTISHANSYTIGERVAQLVLMKLPVVHIEEVTELSTSERGDGGFGSTGK
jgi:dUTP pyrophosphatase